MKRSVLLILVVLLSLGILSACTKKDTVDEESSIVSSDPINDTISGIHEDVLVADRFSGCKYSRGLEDKPLEWFEDKTFVIDYWLVASRQFSEDFYLHDYDDSWLDEYTKFYQESDEIYYAEYGSYPWAHDLNEDGLYIEIHKILNGFEDETILYDDIGHFYGEDEKCSTDIEVINGIRYKDSYLKDVLSGNITSLTKRERDPIISRLYKAVISFDNDHFVYIMITLKGHEEGTDIYLSYEMIDMDPSEDDLPTIEIAYSSNVIID